MARALEFVRLVRVRFADTPEMWRECVRGSACHVTPCHPCPMRSHRRACARACRFQSALQRSRHVPVEESVWAIEALLAAHPDLTDRFRSIVRVAAPPIVAAPSSAPSTASCSTRVSHVTI